MNGMGETALQGAGRGPPASGDGPARAVALLAGAPLGVYVHVPFCSTACDFCAFYQEQGDRQAILDYLAGIEREAALAAVSKPADTFFWGGGTPSLLKAEDLRRLGAAASGAFGKPAREWTVELAPSSVRADKLAALRELGVTRVSLGAQSFDGRLLESLGRQHTPRQLEKALELALAGGFASVNLDLIFAIPGQTEVQWRADLRGALGSGIDHLSTYCLTFEEDTALYVKLSQGNVSIDEAREQAYYEIAWEETRAAGFAQYEIANYARPGKRCLHNMNTWAMGEWIGLGPSAASQSAGWRSANPPDLAKWRADLDSGRRGSGERTALSAAGLLEDALIFGLRMNEGVDPEELERRYGRALPAPARRALDWLEELRLLAWNGGRLRLTPRGRMLADAIGAELLGAFAGGAGSKFQD